MKRNWAALIISTFFTYLLVGFDSSRAASGNNLEIFYIDVGQGDSALIRDSSGFDILIDGGRDYADPVVVDYLRVLGVDDIDVMVASHADSDHIGGLIDVLEMADVPVESVLYNGYPGSSDTWNNFVSAVTNEGLSLITAQYPMTYTWGETTAYILNPAAGLGDPETNEASVVVLLEYGNNHLFFSGDIESDIEAEIVARGTPIVADVLKVAHHGGKTSSSETFLSAVQPAHAVISVGENSYGHPADETLARLSAAGAQIWRTDLQGTILANCDGFTCRVYPLPKIFLPVTMKDFQHASTTGNIQITTVFYDGAGSSEPDEYVEIRNDDYTAIQLNGWTLRDAGNHVFTFPGFVMQPGQICRVYTNEDHPESCGFNYSSGSAIWTNGGDCAYLRDFQGNSIDEYCY